MQPHRTCAAAAIGALLLAQPACAPVPETPTPELPPPAVRPEALSMFGRPLYRPALSPGQAALLQHQLDSATAAFRARPGNADALARLGRGLASLGHYRDAIAAYTRGIALHPVDPRFFRQRAESYIVCRQFDQAIADLQRAARLVAGRPDQTDPDAPPDDGLPLGSLHGNIYYYLGLAHYLRQEYGSAVRYWDQARALARSDDLLVGASYWLYLGYLKLGRAEPAAAVLNEIRTDLRVIENRPYYELLLLFRGDLPPDSIAAHAAASGQAPTYQYGLANWYRLKSDAAEAEGMLREILAGPDWPALGYIAAETELAASGR